MTAPGLEPQPGPGNDMAPFRPAFHPEDADPGPLPRNVANELGGIGLNVADFGHLAKGETFVGETSSAQIVTGPEGANSLQINWAGEDGTEQQREVELTDSSPEAIAVGWGRIFGTPEQASEAHTTGGPSDGTEREASAATNSSADPLSELRDTVEGLSRTAEQIRDSAATMGADVRMATGAATLGAALTHEGNQATAEGFQATRRGLDEVSQSVTEGTQSAERTGQQVTEAVRETREAVNATTAQVRESGDLVAAALASEGEEVTSRLDEIHRLLDDRLPRRRTPAPPEAPVEAEELPHPETDDERANADDIARAWEAVVNGGGRMNLNLITRALVRPGRLGDLHGLPERYQRRLRLASGTLSVRDILRDNGYRDMFSTQASRHERQQIFDPAPELTEENHRAAQTTAIECMREIFRHAQTSGAEELRAAFLGRPLEPNRISMLISRHADPAIREALARGEATDEMLVGILGQYGGNGTVIMALQRGSGFIEGQRQLVAERIRDTRTSEEYAARRGLLETTYDAWWHLRDTTDLRAGEEIGRLSLDQEIANLSWGARQYAEWAHGTRFFALTYPRGGGVHEIRTPFIHQTGSSGAHGFDHNAGFDTIGGIPMPRWMARGMLGVRFVEGAHRSQLLSPDYRDQLLANIRVANHLGPHDRVTLQEVEEYAATVAEIAFSPRGRAARTAEGYPATTAAAARVFIRNALDDYLRQPTAPATPGAPAAPDRRRRGLLRRRGA